MATLRKYKFLMDVNDDGIVYKKGTVVMGKESAKNYVTFTYNGKVNTLPMFASSFTQLIYDITDNLNATVKQWKNTDYYGKAVTVKKTPAKVYLFNAGNELSAISQFTKVNDVVGIASGKAVLMSNNITYYLVNLKTPINGQQFGYVSIQDFYFLTAKADNDAQAKKDAQTLLNKLIESDKKLTKKIFANAAIIGALEKKGQNMDAQKAKLSEILVSIKRRQESIQSNPFIRITDKFNLSGIGCTCDRVGIIPLLIIGAGIAIGGLVVYYFLKPEYNTSQLHSDYLDKNEAELKAKLGDKAYAELKQNVNQEIKDNSQTAYSEGQSQGTFGNIKTILVLGLVGFGIYKLSGTSHTS